ncbi:uncharacterized protein LOC119683646 [Teleopsis dalmanni]|uniref:uncharacterized protein LOC119683646 n=1 Tax=Teleopsis dalmanni TaxID=139649 RepID=UPI0018CD636E|nr:uncharacterized protein LOC119683646 [Teleopsis dalmanni]XP_037953365.1 uncharacterized protein LOC119683646 [Teleopsis dalmanni]XP_037953366.1 uncharacterized protein LOC119683646 [Teleopsis dalmanni]XP_037953367.1 uncharacterized protein LOC119683646 [Teleopsis dalmanni]
MSTNYNSYKMENSVSHGNREINVKKRLDHVVESNNFQIMSSSHSNNSDDGGDDDIGVDDDDGGVDDDENGHAASSSFVNNELYELRGQDWSQFFNLIKDEKKAMDKLHENAANYMQKSSLLSNQVHRLDSNDMHNYGLNPKNTAMDMVVCNHCSGVYKPSGFKNHIRLRHPKIWDMESNEAIKACIESSKQFDGTDIPSPDTTSTWTMDIDEYLDFLSPTKHEITLPEEVAHNKFLASSSKTLIRDEVFRKKYKTREEPYGSIFPGVSSSIVTSTYLNSKNNEVLNSSDNTLLSAVEQSTPQDTTNYFINLTNISKKPNDLGNNYGFSTKGNNTDSSFRNLEPTNDISVNINNTRPVSLIKSVTMNKNSDNILDNLSSKMAEIISDEVSLEMPVYSLDMNSSTNLSYDVLDINLPTEIPYDNIDLNSSTDRSENILDINYSTEISDDILETNYSLNTVNDFLDMNLPPKIPVYSFDMNEFAAISNDNLDLNLLDEMSYGIIDINSSQEMDMNCSTEEPDNILVINCSLKKPNDFLDIKLSPKTAEDILDNDSSPEQSDDGLDINWLPDLPEELMDIDLSGIETTKNMKDSNPHVQTNNPENKYIMPEDSVICQLNTFQTNTPKMWNHLNINTLLHNPSLFVNLTRNDSKATCSGISSNCDSHSSYEESSTYSENNTLSINPTSSDFWSKLTSSYPTFSDTNENDSNHMDTLLNAVKSSPNPQSNSYLRKDCKPVRNRRAALIPKLSKQTRSPDTHKRINDYIKGKQIQRKNI